MADKPLAIITGASAGIGEALAYRLAKAGYDLILTGRNEQRLTHVAQRCQQDYQACVSAHLFDLCDRDSLAQWCDAILAQGRAIDLLVNNAGRGIAGPFVDNDWSVVDEVIQLNMTALTYICHRLLLAMIATKHGKILNVASMAAFIPGPNMAVYYASKAYVHSLSLALDAECGYQPMPWLNGHALFWSGENATIKRPATASKHNDR